MRAAVPLLPTNIRKSENKQKKLTNKPHEPQGLSFYATAEISTTSFFCKMCWIALELLHTRLPLKKMSRCKCLGDDLSCFDNNK